MKPKETKKSRLFLYWMHQPILTKTGAKAAQKTETTASK